MSIVLINLPAGVQLASVDQAIAELAAKQGMVAQQGVDPFGRRTYTVGKLADLPPRVSYAFGAGPRGPERSHRSIRAGAQSAEAGGPLMTRVRDLHGKLGSVTLARQSMRATVALLPPEKQAEALCELRPHRLRLESIETDLETLDSILLRQGRKTA